jgi:uncharacterized protein YcfJ
MERNAAGGAVIGGVAGAVIGNNVGDGDAGQGAAIGAAVGAAAGVARGYSQDQRLAECRDHARQSQFFDQSANRYYYQVAGTDRTCWANGQPRT